MFGLSDLLSLVKALSPSQKVLAGIVLGTASILFIPNSWVLALALDEVRAAAKPHVQIAFVLASALFVTQGIAQVGSRFWDFVSAPLKSELLKRKFNRLSPDEKFVVVSAMLEFSQTVIGPSQWEVAQALADKGFFELNPTIRGRVAFYHIPYDVWEMLGPLRGGLRKSIDTNSPAFARVRGAMLEANQIWRQ